MTFFLEIYLPLMLTGVFRVTLERILQTLENNRTSNFLIAVLIILFTHIYINNYKQKLRSIKMLVGIDKTADLSMESVYDLSLLFDHRCLWSQIMHTITQNIC